MRIVILCGGAGHRLWPESRESLPKQFIPIFNEKSLLDLSVERVIKLMQKTKPIFICNKKHNFLVKKTIDRYKIDADIFLEPEGKDTCAAIYLSAKHCSKNDSLIIMPSDHLISDNEIFIRDLSIIEQNITSKQWITLGIKPTKPSDAYGYIQVEKKDNNKLKKVIKFVEKPEKNVASEFIKKSDFYWNSGIFIAKASMIINSINKHAPDIAKHCDKNYDKIKIDRETNEINFSRYFFSKIPSRSIDYAVMENEKNIFLYPLNTDWNDVGSWDSISEIYKEKNNSSKVVQIDSNNNFIRTKEKIIATIGVKDLIIIDSDNATLISKKNQSEKVKLVVNKLHKNKSVEAKEHSFEYRPWGKFENLLEDKYCKIKRIIIDKNRRLSLQYHNFRSEHWLIISGIANVFLDQKKLTLTPGQSIDIPKKCHHYIENKQNKKLIIIETQLGSYFGEDDIIRLDDPYKR